MLERLPRAATLDHRGELFVVISLVDQDSRLILGIDEASGAKARGDRVYKLCGRGS
jgi:hypothetical protein